MLAISFALLFAATAAACLMVLARDGAHLVRRHGEWDAQLAQIDRDALCDPAAFTLRPAGCATRRCSPPRQRQTRRAAA